MYTINLRKERQKRNNMYAIAINVMGMWQIDYNNQYEYEDSAKKDIERYKSDNLYHLSDSDLKVVEL